MSQPISRFENLDRRGFLKASTAALGVAGLAGLSAMSSAAAAELKASGPRIRLAKKDVILFQGDSITDASRNKQKTGIPNDQSALGTGYAWMAAAELLLDRPADNFSIYNRGVSGNEVHHLAERWDKDCLELKPDVLSILIGVNDIWHTLQGSYAGTLEIYEKDYRALLERTQKALPKVKLVICEPFVLRTGQVSDKWFPEFDHYRAAARRVAESFKATFVPFQAMFDEAIKYGPPDQWAKDGVHPTPAGASLMAHHWLKAVNS